ncbi:chemotaxis-specific protein-glutamate methyltransferase CheB [Desulfobacterales bacterium HSG16]|nr:chemotaxis-specific protein-glutamate methyltransferase CheB [Desulfobacterales bacterium HSG16]
MTLNLQSINVLIVDDSLVARELLIYILNSDPEINILGIAENGEKALAFIKKHKPDVITMDVHMPGLNGYETTQKIMGTQPVPIVTVSTAVDEQSVDDSFRSMEAGALAIVEKPRGIDDPAHRQMADHLIKTVKLMSEVKVVRRRMYPTRTKPPLRFPDNRKLYGRRSDIKIVAMGVSTGGPPVVQTILSLLPSNFEAPVLIVQHIAAGFLHGMADWLRKESALPVHIAAHKDSLMSGHVYLAPDNYHMGVTRGSILLSKKKPGDCICPSVSHLFRSVSEVFKENAAGVILTGMGRDGAEELLLIKNYKGVTIAQNKESCVVFGMPEAAVSLGAVQYVLPPDKIAQKLIQLVRGHHGNI